MQGISFLTEDVKTIGRELAQEFLEFNSDCPSPYHVVQKGVELLRKKGFQEIGENLEILPGGQYFLTRGFNSSLVAFTIPRQAESIKRFRIVATHTDSPGIRVAPQDKVNQAGFVQTNVQLYGGGLWHTWIDWDLVLGGRVVLKKEEKLQSVLYWSWNPIAKVSSMCIHLKDSNPLDIDKEKDLKPILATELNSQLIQSKDGSSLLMQTISKELKVAVENIKGFDLCFSDAQNPSLVGVDGEFISSQRIDNVYSFFSSLKAITKEWENQTEEDSIQICFAFDHEEIGSQTYVGADSDYTKNLLQRISQKLNLDFDRVIQQSFLLSCDMAHSVHPSFTNLYQQFHRPMINQGVVLKINCNGRYTTDSVSQAIVKTIAEKAQIPIQEFIVSNNTRCGSTVGPTLASRLLCLAADIGMPALGMHSIRETAGVFDFCFYIDFMYAFWNQKLDWSESAF